MRATKAYLPDWQIFFDRVEHGDQWRKESFARTFPE